MPVLLHYVTLYMFILHNNGWKKYDAHEFRNFNISHIVMCPLFMSPIVNTRKLIPRCLMERRKWKNHVSMLYQLLKNGTIETIAHGRMLWNCGNILKYLVHGILCSFTVFQWHSSMAKQSRY